MIELHFFLSLPVSGFPTVGVNSGGKEPSRKHEHKAEQGDPRLNSCVGKRLAMMVLRLVISYTVFHFHLEFAPSEDGAAIYKEVKNHVILKAGSLMLTLKRRT